MPFDLRAFHPTLSAAICTMALAAPVAAQSETSDQSVVQPLLADAAGAYAHGLAAIAGWAILMAVLGLLSVIGTPRAKTESGHPVRDYADPAYRRNRAFQNAIETTGPFLAAALTAILVGASPFWTNLFASLFLVARIAMAVVHIGTEIQPLRSLLWMVGQICVLGLALIALVGAFLL